MKKNKILILVLLIFMIANATYSQKVPSDRISSTNEISLYLKKDIQKELVVNNYISQSDLAAYFRRKFSDRYFFSWRDNDKRFSVYKSLYQGQEKAHTERALDHMTKYPDSTKWLLPFNYQYGKPVNAYALRHLARQHKMVDIAYLYYYEDKNPKYLNYFKTQLRSLNAAFKADNYEKLEITP